MHATDIFKAVAHLHLPLNLQLLNVLPIGNYHNDQKVTTKHGYDAWSITLTSAGVVLIVTWWYTDVVSMVV